MTPPRSVLLFESVSAALQAEKILKAVDIAHKIIPVPKHISSDCGVCIRVDEENLDRALQALQGRVVLQDTRQLP
ncbi:MAG TPA: DUF3343 domain-containing protein [Deltaproteobacteria bacterium]|nr:DUF3343 domain-containing protein [Deltaproteobacteria bacterium]HPR54666.1 DUF3343 domain-containing protein [Deltaproteobacteria bacterium]